MIYLAILLVLCGVLILITALSVETGIISSAGNMKSGTVNRSSGNDESDSNADLKSDDIEIIFPGDRISQANDGFDNFDNNDIFVNFDEETSDSFKPEPVFEDNSWKIESDDFHQNKDAFWKERRKVNTSRRADKNENREKTFLRRRQEDGLVTAVMFDDRSNIIDYDSGSGVIDTTFSKYKSIQRIGKGKIESDYDGVSFYLDEKLYRFDFHKVYDVWSGPNYIALPLKGSSTVKLFIIENSPDFPEKVESNFKEYEKGL